MTSYRVTVLRATEPGRVEVEVGDDDYLVDAFEEQGHDVIPYACRAGACPECVAVLVSGRVDQSDQSFLRDEEMAAGLVLTCVAYAESDCVLDLDAEPATRTRGRLSAVAGGSGVRPAAPPGLSDPDRFWELVDSAGDADGFTAALRGMGRHDLIRFCWDFQATVDRLKAPPWTDVLAVVHGRLTDRALDDVCRFVVEQGRDFYDEVLRHPERIPLDRDLGNALLGVSSLAVTVYEERYGEPVPARSTW